jgi:hypothetical protein
MVKNRDFDKNWHGNTQSRPLEVLTLYFKMAEVIIAS